MPETKRRARRELWELKGMDSFGNLVFMQEVKLDRSNFQEQEYLLDSFHAAIAKGSIKIILERSLPHVDG